MHVPSMTATTWLGGGLGTILGFELLGVNVGFEDGVRVGSDVGAGIGNMVGLGVMGVNVGFEDGVRVGSDVGAGIGNMVGLGVMTVPVPMARIFAKLYKAT